MTTNVPTQSIDTLNDLVKVCEDGCAGYLKAAELTSDPILKTTFARFGAERGQFANQLRTEVRRLGGEPQDSGSLAGAAHRAWFDVKTTFASDDAKAVVNECERGEDHAIGAYKSALEQPLAPSARDIVRAQCNDVQQAHDRMHQLQVAYNKS